MKPLLVAAALLALACPAQAGSGCAPLLTDPRGDAMAGPAPADDVAAVDVVSAELRLTSRELVGTVRVADLPEGGSVASHWWALGFSVREQRYRVAGSDDVHQDYFDAARLVSGDRVPEDGLGGNAFEGIGTGTGTIDVARDTVTIRIPLQVFAPYGGIRGTLTDVRAVTATGLGVPFGSVYELGDRGRTDRSYRPGARC